MFVLISITIACLGFYALGAGESPVAGIGLVVAGIFAGLLSIKVSSLQEQLDWERKLAKQHLEKELETQKKAKKAPAKKTIKDSPPTLKAQPPIDPEPAPPEPEPEPEDSSWLEPDGTPSEPFPIVKPTDAPKIITRTSQVAGGRAQETWQGERTWAQLEVDELLELYSQGALLESIAIKLRMDKKDIVYKLTRLNFEDSGDLEDTSEAPNDGKAWSEDHSIKLIEMNIAGISLTGMAKILGRTKLAIGWRLGDQRRLNRLS